MKIADPRNPALEDAILEDPDNGAAYEVLADWLEEQGDPRAQLVRVPVNAPLKARKLLAAHAAYLLGPLVRFQERLTWRHGYIHRAEVHDHASLEALLRHPSARFLRELDVDHVTELGATLIAETAPRSLRALALSNPARTPITLAALVSRATTIQSLGLAGGFVTSGLVLAEVATLALAGNNSTNHPIRSLWDVPLPRLRKLAYQARDAEPTFAKFLQRTDIALEDLVLETTLDDGLIDALAALPGASRLRTLDLEQATVSNDALETLASALSAFPNLATLTLGRVSDDVADRFERPGLDFHADRYDPHRE